MLIMLKVHPQSQVFGAVISLHAAESFNITKKDDLRIMKEDLGPRV